MGPELHFPHGGHGWGPGRAGTDRGSGWDGPPWWDWWPLLPTALLAVLVLTGMALLSQRGAAVLNRTPLLSEPAGFPAEPASWWPGRWQLAVTPLPRRPAGAYGEFECDLQAVLRLPALADVSEPSTARFVDAFAEAIALDTEGYPGPEYAQRFLAAVERAERAWAAAVDAAERIRDARFAPGERRLVGQVSTLLELALSSPYEAERRGAYQRAVRRLAELERRSGWRLPRPAAGALEHRARPELASAG